MSLRAVLMIPARRTTGTPSSVATATAAAKLPVGCSSVNTSPRRADRPGWSQPMIREQRRGRYGDCTEHSDRLMASVRDEGPRTQVTACLRRSDHGEFGHGCLGNVAQVHHVPCGEPDRLELCSQGLVCLQLSTRLVTSDAHCCGGHDHDGHAVVDQGHRDSVDLIDDVAGRQQAAGAPSGEPLEVDGDRGCRARDTRDSGLACILGHSVLDIRIRRWRRCRC